MPNEAHEYLQGRTTPLTTRSFNPKRYATKPIVKVNAISHPPENIPIFKRALERRNTFRKSVGIEAAKVHPLEKKVKRRRKFRVFPTRKTITHGHLAGGSEFGNKCPLTRQPSVVLHVKEEPVRSGSQVTTLKRWLSSDVLAEREPILLPRGVGVVCNINISANDECTVAESPTPRKKWRERMREWLQARS